MRCKIKYSHHKNGSLYYFIDFRLSGADLLPVGCHPIYRDTRATIFETKRDANKVVKYLRSIGCDYAKAVSI